MLKIYSNHRFQVCNILLLTTIIMLYFRSPELIHLLTNGLYPWPAFSHLLMSTYPWYLPFYYVSLNLISLKRFYIWDHTVFVYLWLLSLSIMPSSSIHLSQMARFSLFIHPLAIQSMFPLFRCYEQSCNEHSCTPALSL